MRWTELILVLLHSIELKVVINQRNVACVFLTALEGQPAD